jgi:hypothetical protein
MPLTPFEAKQKQKGQTTPNVVSKPDIKVWLPIVPVPAKSTPSTPKLPDQLKPANDNTGNSFHHAA